MRKLNCAVGDLAITVNCSYPKNLGNIVRIISAVGYEEWASHDELIYTWNVEIATDGSFLYYQYEGENFQPFTAGPVPDAYLRRLTPPSGYLMDEFSDSEQMHMNFHEVESEEGERSV
ncbi:hypothetical protein G6677_07840 [Polynucleobacter paneuropaeus]|nr:hypothetical protein [Polynucleobacter paneuropaeus]